MKPKAHQPRQIVRAVLAAGGLFLAALPVLAGDATRSVSERVAADPKGTVEVENVAGKITLAAWDRAEVAVSGTIGSGVKKVEVTRDGVRTSVRVILPSSMFSVGGEHSATLTIYVPRESAASVSLVSADLVVSGITGFENLRSVSGNIIGEVGGEAKVKSVSGDIELEAPGKQPLNVQSVSGDIRLHSLAEQVQVASVSGNETILLGAFTRAKFETVSGDVKLVGALAAGGGIEGQSISGDLKVDLAGAPGGDYDVRTLSGDISNCFGPRAVRPQYGPGARANFREGEGTARVSLETKSGNVHLCNQAVLPPVPREVSDCAQAPEARERRYSLVL